MFGVLYTKLFIQNNRHINMPIAGRLNDKGTRHDGYYETVILAGSPTVFIDGLPLPEPVMRWTVAGGLLAAVR